MAWIWNVSHRLMLWRPISYLVHNLGKLRNLRGWGWAGGRKSFSGKLLKIRIQILVLASLLPLLGPHDVNSLHTRSCCRRLNLPCHGGLKVWAEINISFFKSMASPTLSQHANGNWAWRCWGTMSSLTDWRQTQAQKTNSYILDLLDSNNYPNLALKISSPWIGKLLDIMVPSKMDLII